jgi:pimeloyl-ACP methyl ester carboxylesterase
LRNWLQTGWAIALGVLAIGTTGCGNMHREAMDANRLRQAERQFAGGGPRIAPELAAKILALNPTNVSTREVQEVLRHAPAPRVVKIHGGIASVIPRMVSFSEFLIGMGYPASSLTNPSDGTYSFSCYESADKIAGVIAWFYEKEGLRPMMVGHSQGGMQVVKVLQRYAQKPSARLNVWNPLTWKEENRHEIRDPLTGRMRPVVGLTLPYASSVGAGGVTRLLPNQWDMTWKLRSVPDTVEDFTGFCMQWDILGGDLLGYGSGNEFKANGKAQVRNVWLPTKYDHGYIPDTKHLVKDPKIVDWLNRYHPDGKLVSHPVVDESQFDGDSSNIIWAAEGWFYIKKHWVLELQRYLRAHGAREGKP